MAILIDSALWRWRDWMWCHMISDTSIAELKTFVRDDNGSMHGSPHDDRVMSLAIANQMLKYVWLPEYRPKSDAPFGTLNYFASKLRKPQKEKDRYLIGEFSSY